MKRTEAHYWRVEDPAMFTPDQFPVFIGCFSDDEKDLDMRMYGIPILEYPGLLKVYTVCMAQHCFWSMHLAILCCKTENASSHNNSLA